MLNDLHLMTQSHYFLHKTSTTQSPNFKLEINISLSHGLIHIQQLNSFTKKLFPSPRRHFINYRPFSKLTLLPKY